MDVTRHELVEDVLDLADVLFEVRGDVAEVKGGISGRLKHGSQKANAAPEGAAFG